MKYQIMLEILFLLLSKKRVTAQGLAREYGLSRRTIMRYIQAIELAGVPIYSEKGRYGGFYTPQSFNLLSCFLTESETGIIIDLLTACQPIIGEDKGNTLKNKLITLNKINSKSLPQITNRIIIDSEDLSSEKSSNLISNLNDAINNLKQAVVCFKKGAVLESKTLNPHALKLQNGAWYLVAFCSQENEFYVIKLSDIIDVFLLKNSFTRSSISA